MRTSSLWLQEWSHKLQKVKVKKPVWSLIWCMCKFRLSDLNPEQASGNTLVHICKCDSFDRRLCCRFSAETMWKRRRGLGEQACLSAASKTQQQFLELATGWQQDLGFSASRRGPGWRGGSQKAYIFCYSVQVKWMTKCLKVIYSHRVREVPGTLAFLYKRPSEGNKVDTLDKLLKHTFVLVWKVRIYLDGYIFEEALW